MKKRTPTILVLIGCPCSGKSTFAEYYLKFHDALRINRDELRMMLQFKEQLEPEDESLLSRMVEKMVETAIQKGRDVLLDNTHTKKEFINQIIEKFNHIANIEFKVFDVPIEELLQRNANRARKVPIQVIKDMYARLQHLKQQFDFQPLPRKGVATDATKIIQDYNLPKAILCDLDGTLAIANRNMFRPSEEEMYADILNEPVAIALRGFGNNAKIIFMSGREDLYFNISKKWIEDKLQITDFELFMRPANDTRKDSIIKEELLRNKVLPHYHVLGVFDDRLQVCRMWYEKGIFCFNVNQGLIEF